MRRYAQTLSLAVLAAIAGLAWWLLVEGASTMTQMDGDPLLLRVVAAMMQPQAVVAYLAAVSAMWVLMMVAMMTPAILPVLLTFQRMDTARPPGATCAFAAGYLGVWALFGVALTVLQWLLNRASLLESHTMIVSPASGAVMLIVAGLYQLTPFKRACLAHCQTPLGFLLHHWQPGLAGAVRMGAQHGRYCLGCCWALMLLMFAGGVMSVGAMALIAIFILAERLLPAGSWSAFVPGLLMIGSGVAILWW